MPRDCEAAEGGATLLTLRVLKSLGGSSDAVSLMRRYDQD